MVSSVNGSSNASLYLQSLLKSDTSKPASGSDQIQSLLAAFYPNGQASAPDTGTGSSATTGAPSQSCAGGPSFSSGTMSQMISAQSDLGSPHTQSLFAKMDADGDGKVSQSEFENVFGSNADKSKVDGLFAALDSDGDGSVSGTEFASAVKGGSGHHHHGHGGGGGGGLQDLLSGTDATGATTSTVTAPDGSTTTTIKYADGSSISTTSAASNANATVADSSTRSNALEQLIRQQAQVIASVAGNLATTLATI